MKAGIVISCAVLVGLLAGCIHRPGGIAPSNIPLDGRSYRVVGPATASDSSVWLFGILPLSGSNNIEEAINKAIHSRQADALIGITVESYDQWWILFSRHVTSVRGQAIQFD